MISSRKIPFTSDGGSFVAGRKSELGEFLFIKNLSMSEPSRVTDISENYLVLDSKKDIAPLLKQGKNRVQLRLYSSLRNLLGPHHYAPEPGTVGSRCPGELYP